MDIRLVWTLRLAAPRCAAQKRGVYWFIDRCSPDVPIAALR
jgi:hypothetical protein